MNRSALLALPLCLALAAVAQAGIKTSHFSITTGDREYLAVQEGKLALGNRSRSDESKREPDRWLVEGGQIRNSTTGRYLTYDPKDKEGKVFLAVKPVEGARWVVGRRKGKPKNDRADDTAEWGVIEAGSGAKKGCLLDFDDDQSKGVKFVLRKQPKANVEIVRLYTHR